MDKLVMCNWFITALIQSMYITSMMILASKETDKETIA